MRLSQVGAVVLVLAVLGGAVWWLFFASPQQTPTDNDGMIVVLAYAVREPGQPFLQVTLGLKELALTQGQESTKVSWLTERLSLIHI